MVVIEGTHPVAVQRLSSFLVNAFFNELEGFVSELVNVQLY